MNMPAEAVAGGAKPHWLAYVVVPEVDKSTARAQELGAKVMVPPTSIPTVGRFAVIADPQGALIAPYTPDRSGRSRKGSRPWASSPGHELATTDPVAAFDFYHEIFGWEKTSAMDMGEAGVYQMYGRHGAPLGGIYKPAARVPGSASLAPLRPRGGRQCRGRDRAREGWAGIEWPHGSPRRRHDRHAPGRPGRSVRGARGEVSIGALGAGRN